MASLSANISETALNAPVAPKERIVAIDVVRGFALFGVLLVNMMYFAWPIYRQVLDIPWTHPVDRFSHGLLIFLAEGKFFTLFSLLFGLGLALQMRRSEGIVSRFMRRMLVLLGFGLAHMLLLWYGDILIYYALLGMLLLLFRNCQPRTLLRWAISLLLLPIVLNGGLFALISLGQNDPEVAAEIQAGFEQSQVEYRQLYDQAIQSYQQGSFADMVNVRIGEYAFGTLGTLLNGMLFMVLAMFLLGLYIGKRQILQDIPAHLPLFRRVRAWGFGVGLLANAGYTLLYYVSNLSEPSLAVVAAVLTFVIGAPALCLAYASSIVLLYQQSQWRRRLQPLAAVGRMALSNYLAQSIIATTLFFGYGFGLYASLSPTLGIGLTLVIFSVQIVLSRWWLQHYRFGPAEWLWRSLSYGRPQTMRLEPTSN